MVLRSVVEAAADLGYPASVLGTEYPLEGSALEGSATTSGCVILEPDPERPLGAAGFGTLIASPIRVGGEIAAVESGQLSPRMEPAALAGIVTRVVDDLTEVLAGHEVSLDISSSLSVEADRILLHRAIENVLVNAGELHAPRHGVDAGTAQPAIVDLGADAPPPVSLGDPG